MSLFTEINKILIISAHIDDGELMAGGTISQLVLDGKDVYYVSFTIDNREKEVENAIAILGIPKDKLILYNFPIRDLQSYRQEILEEMVKLDKKINPDLIITTSERDTHQDHPVIAREVFRAFKRNSSIICGELPWNNRSFEKNLIIPLSEYNIKKKELALRCYYSQKDKFYMKDGVVRSLAISNGFQINKKYAESFEIIRKIGL